jgi:hypothetical protein
MVELRVVTALLASKYDISLGPGENGTRLFDDCKDVFVASPGELRLVLKPRS